MARYKKKQSRIIEAVQWNGGPILFNAPKWLINAQHKGEIRFISDEMAIINGLQYDMVVNVGDYIIQGVDDIYVLKAKVFESRFDLVGED